MTRDKKHTQASDPLELTPAMSKEEADAEIRELGVSQDQIDLDISHLDMNDLVDPKYLPAIAAKLLREGKMPNFKKPSVLNQFTQIMDKAIEEVQAERQAGSAGLDGKDSN